MGKYVKKTKVAKNKSTTNKGAVKVEQKRKKVKARAKAAKQKRLAQFASDRSARCQDVENEDEEITMAVDSESRNSGEKLVSFLERAKSEKKATEAVKNIVRDSRGQRPEVLGVALGHLAGRGLAQCVKILIENGALLNIQDPHKAAGRSTPLQLAASRGHVHTVRFLVEAGADKAGAVEAARDLNNFGTVFAEERKAILAILSR
ncbi:unnamed protein product [Durusdinium trenchii]|uniref:Uncharacterized protein n=1 Tax=Durusdinium trenchii TaxID=1381693 RepID=A0ABP0HNW9_9DINO